MTKRKAVVKATEPTLITNCNFYGVQWDAKAVQSVQTVAEALLNLTKLFASQSVQIDAMLKIESPEIEK